MTGRSFASVLNGKDETQKTTSVGSITKCITLENSDLVELSDTSSIVLAKVKVREFANWVPDIASLDNISQHTYESGATDNEHDIHDKSELQEEGEINDKEEPFGHQINAPGSTRIGRQEEEKLVKGNFPDSSFKESWADDLQKAEQHPPQSKRIGSNINLTSATAFNEIIIEGRFWAIPLGGHSFMCITSNGEKLSKLDHFLISEDIPNVIYNLQATVIDCYTSDHRPIVLKQSKLDFSPSPFKLFNSWMLNPQFDALVTLSWNSAQHLDGKRRFLVINGIMKDGIWLTDPNQIKDTFFHFLRKNSKNEGIGVKRKSAHYNTLSLDHNRFLESVISEQEIRNAMWACGSDKSPGLDGFLFAFYKKYWDVLKLGILAFVQDFYSSGYIPQGCNLSFITLIPKLNSPTVVLDFRPISLIGEQYKHIAKILANRLSQLIDWYKRKKKTLMVFKIDFEKDFDSVLWDFIFQVLKFMGFGQLLISWIRGCLFSVITSVLLNGSPSREFSLHQGLRQGDPLSPFLFILVMEGLSVAIKDAIFVGLFMELESVLSKSLTYYSQMTFLFLIYPCFFGSWSLGNIQFIAFPIPVTIANSLEAMLAKFFWGYTDGERKMQWIEWKSVLASKKYGGLRIGSLQALNLSLIQKWRWRYVHNHHALWVKVISSIHGPLTDGTSFNNLQKNSMWARIVNSIKDMHDKGIILHSNLRRKLNNGVSIKFWHDVWIGDSSLSTLFPRLFCLDSDPDCFVRDGWINGSWSWSWSRPITGGSLISQLQAISDLLHSSHISKNSHDVLGMSNRRY
ncbi:RNA-directed DNA polymerase, eukaryota, reverse transcriptase zinc-binding domain protein [Tanacetum coccineum]